MNLFLKVLGAAGGRKFIVTAMTGVILGFAPGLTPEIAMSIAGVASSFILGQAFADGQSGGATSTTAIAAKISGTVP